MVLRTASPVRQLEATASPSLGIGVVGVGYWGPNLVRNLANLPQCQLLGVADLNQAQLDALREKHPSLRTTNFLSDLLEDPAIEAMFIATPAQTHRKIAELCLRAGKHVYVEKPLATNSADAQAMVTLANDLGKVLMVGHLFLYDPAIATLIQMVRGGAIGDIRYVHTVRTSMAGTARLDTNVLWDAMIHDAYLLRELFGRRPYRALAVGQGYLTQSIEDVAFVTFDFGDSLAHVYASWYALEKARRTAVIGSNAILAYSDLADARLMFYKRRYEQSAEHDAEGRRRWHWHDEGGEEVPVPKAEPLRAECEHFINSVLASAQPRTDGQAGIEAVRILEACQRSLDTGNQWVEV